jgi:hypothetical protein
VGLFLGLLASFVKWLSSSFANFFIALYIFPLLIYRAVYILDSNPLLVTCIVHIFFDLLSCLFTLFLTFFFFIIILLYWSTLVQKFL